LNKGVGKVGAGLKSSGSHKKEIEDNIQVLRAIFSFIIKQ